MIWLVLAAGFICLSLAGISSMHAPSPDRAIQATVNLINYSLTLIGLGCVGYFILDSLFSGPKKPKSDRSPRAPKQ